MTITKTYGQVNKLLKFEWPGVFSQGVAARLPEEYKKFWNEWKVQQREPVHYIPEPGKWKRNPVTGVVKPVQNISIPLQFPNESNKGLWGGEAVIKGFQKRDPCRRRVPHFWFPTLMRSVVYSEILNKHMSIVLTQRTLDLIHKNYGLDHYILKTPACDLQSELALKLKRTMLLALYEKNLYPEDKSKREEVYNTYKHYVENYTKEEIDWYGLNMFEAIKKQMSIEEAEEKQNTVPLKLVYRAQLIEKLRDAGREGVKAVMEEYDASASEQKSSSWLSKLNPFSSRKQKS